MVEVAGILGASGALAPQAKTKTITSKGSTYLQERIESGFFIDANFENYFD